MEYMEIILKDIPIPFLKTILSEPLIFYQADILSSHFFSSAVGRTCQYAEVRDWDAFLQGAGTSDMLLAKLDIGMELKNVVVLISHESSPGDITIHFGEDQLHVSDAAAAKQHFQKLFQKLTELLRTGLVSSIAMGYEPAEDPDMQILELRRGLFRTFCKNISHSPELQELCRVGNTYFCLSGDT